MILKNLLTIFVIFVPLSLIGQKLPRFFYLEEILNLAIENALDLKESNSILIENKSRIAYFETKLSPQVYMNATLPNLSRSIESRPLPDGRDAFVNRSTMYNRIGITMNYQLVSTGGIIYAQSGIDRLDVLKTKQLDYSRNYFYTPIAIGINQPLFTFNEIKWQKEKNNLLLHELNAEQIFVREEVIQNALDKFTTAFLAQLQKTLAERKLAEADTLLPIKQRLFEIGKTTKIELLRLTQEWQRNKQLVDRAELDWERAKLQLCDYLNLDADLIGGLHPPPAVPQLVLKEDEVLQRVRNNAYIVARNTRRLREAEAKIEMAEKEHGIEIDFNATLGFNKSTDQLNGLLQNLEGRQMLSLGVTIPITGKQLRIFHRDIAAQEFYREKIIIERELIDLTRSVIVSVRTYNLLNKDILLNRNAMENADEIYRLSSQQYLLGLQSLTDLNTIRMERDQAMIQYYRSILDARIAYYEIRKSCMYDFQENKSLLINNE